MYRESYDKLILSPGAHAVIPNLPGIDSERIFTLRTVEDTFKVHGFVETARPASAVVVGGGFIGLEMAENLLETAAWTSRWSSAADTSCPRLMPTWPRSPITTCAHMA